MTDYENCVQNNETHIWYLKKTCYNESSIPEYFRHLDKCIRNGSFEVENQKTMNEKRNWLCSVFLEFNFDSRLSAEDFLGIKNCSDDHCPALHRDIFEGYDACLDEWLPLKRTQMTQTTSTTGRLRVNLNYNDGGGKRLSTVGKALNETGRSMSEMIFAYCKAIHKDETLISCVRKVVWTSESFSTLEFFNEHLKSTAGKGWLKMAGLDWPLPLALILSWVLVRLGVWKGVKIIGKLVYFIAIFAVVMSIALDIYSLLLEGRCSASTTISRLPIGVHCSIRKSGSWLLNKCSSHSVLAEVDS